MSARGAIAFGRTASRARPLAFALAAALALEPGANAAPAARSFSSSSAARLPAQVHTHAGGRERRQPMAPAGGIDVVTNCNDEGAGSLREAIDTAAEGDVIDLTELTCGTITLASGAIRELFDDLTLVGPGPERLTIQGTHADTVISHGGIGALGIYGVTIANGRYEGPAPVGGCLTSAATLRLYRAVVTGCEHESNSGGAAVLGGAIVAERLYLMNSTISDSRVASTSAPAYGGGAWVWRRLYANGSTIGGNSATGYRGNTGGIAAYGDVSIKRSTIAGNTAAFNAGLALFAHYQADQFAILDSTISGNVATRGVGGIGTNATTLIANTTIALNREGGSYSGGLFVGDDATVRLVGSIVADNYAGSAHSDIGGTAAAQVIGSHDLVRLSTLALPVDTILADPLLAPLADNGGLTKTHALAATSPALDVGDASYGSTVYDQRGAGFARIVGGGADIGAYERQTTGTVHTITSCADSGNGSLREALSQAVSGDAVDLSALGCGTITLTSGALEIDAGNLFLRGPGAARLTIDGGNADRVIVHAGDGTLAASGLTFAHGSFALAGNSRSGGGCIRSYRSVHLADVVVASCRVDAHDAYGYGGAIYADRVLLDRTTISNNRIDGVDGHAYGGGLFASIAEIRDSTIAGNAVATTGSAYGNAAGGVDARSALDIERSTISGNAAGQFAGGVLFANDGFGVPPLRIVDSTISGNVGGGLFAAGFAEILNSTLTLNTPTAFPLSGLGMLLSGTAHIDSTIVFGNLGPDGDAADIGNLTNAVLVGQNDLIGVSGPAVPRGTLSTDPLLGPLQDNGGPTRTHALPLGSPAVDTGNNTESLIDDQRGQGFARTLGSGTDIGAVEFDPDLIFRNGFG